MKEARLGVAVEQGGIPADALVLRPMEPADIDAVGALALEQGRNVDARDYARFLALEGARGFVVVQGGTLVGAATAMRYFEHAVLGPVILRREADGVAIALLAHLVEAMQRDGVTTIEAEAGASEAPILERMGFATARRTLVMERPPGGIVPSEGSIAMETHHLLDVGSLDAAAVGWGRKEYIAALARELPFAARVLVSDGEVVGFALLRRAPRGFALGPLVTRADDAAAAMALLRDALSAAAGERVVALVPEGSPLRGSLEREGFRDVGTLSRMRAGPPADARGGATEWALGSRITG